MQKALAASCLAGFLASCATIGGELPKTPGELASNYGYIPLDPLPVAQTMLARSCTEAVGAGGKPPQWKPMLEALPDLSIRFAVAELAGNGQLAFGPSKVTAKGSAYRAILDYVNVDVVPVEFRIRRRIVNKVGDEKWAFVSQSLPGEWNTVAYEAEIVGAPESAHPTPSIWDKLRQPQIAENYERVTVPVYIGLGLRLSADIRALEGGINLSGLGSIGAQADAKRLTGTLTVQTLGVTGKAVATALPLPNKLDQTTIENGILSIGTSRAILYNTGADQITTSPRIVGLYSPLGSDPRLINAFYSALSGYQLLWARPCV